MAVRQTFYVDEAPELFRKTSKPPEVVDAAEAHKTGGKGRPTPSRKEAEAARKERIKATVAGKATGKGAREQDRAARRKAFDGMKRGEERYLLPRDKGPVRRYVRDWVDSRVMFVSFAVPLMVAMLLLPIVGASPVVVSNIWMTLFLLMILEILWIVFRLRRDLRRRFPDENLRGTTMYGLMRAIQMRFMRMPKPQVSIGRKPQ